MSRIQAPLQSWPRALLGGLVALLAAFIAVVGIATLMMFLAGMALADSERTYEARLGEQDRRLVTEQPNYGSPIHVGDYLASVTTDTVDVLVSTEISCHEQNQYLYYMLADIARYIGRNPTVGFVFKGAIQDIHNAWCIK